RESGAAERMQRGRDSLADAAKRKKSEESVPQTRAEVPRGGKSPNTKEQASSNGEGIGKAFALIADLSKVLPDEQGTAIRDRMKKIYRKMEAIRKRDGLD